MGIDRKVMFGEDAESFVNITKRLLKTYDDEDLGNLYRDLVSDISIELGQEQLVQNFERDLTRLLKNYVLGKAQDAVAVHKAFSEEDWRTMAHTIREDIDSFAEKAIRKGDSKPLLNQCAHWDANDDKVLRSWLDAFID